jgi:1,4-dihydroxy-2-naphthoate octaprenyltransferase
MAPENQPSSPRKASVRGFLILSRIPFLSPGIAALVTGMLLAILADYEPDIGLLIMSLVGLSLIMLTTYYFNEYFDYEGDIINKSYIVFSGGSRAIPDRLVPRILARLAGYGSVGVLVVIAVTYMLFYFDDFPALLPLALFGAFCGVFYSHPPFQWSYKGIGEIIIGGCYGILAMVSGYYVVSGVLEVDLLLVAMPASMTIFCVIVANEFPDIQADRAVNKLNLIVRLGLRRGSVMFSVVMLLTYPVMASSILVGVDWTIIAYGLPVLLLTVYAALLTMRGGYDQGPQQIKISGATLLANLLSSLMFVPAAVGW